MIEMILTLYVQLKVPIGCHEEFTCSSCSWLIISVEEIEKIYILFYI
jgi:hypothetical protein